MTEILFYIICGVFGFLAGRAYQAVKKLTGNDYTIGELKDNQYGVSEYMTGIKPNENQKP